MQYASLEATACQPTDILNTPEAASYLKLAPATLARKRIKGGGPIYYKLGKSVRYRRADLDTYLAGRMTRSTSDSVGGVK